MCSDLQNAAVRAVSKMQSKREVPNYSKKNDMLYLKDIFYIFKTNPVKIG